MSSSDVVPSLEFGGNRFATITDDDHSGILWITSILCFVYTLLVFAIRLEARRKNFGLDDAFAIIGTILASIQYALIIIAIRCGMGKSYATLNASDAAMVGKYVAASQPLLLLSLALAKCSVIVLCRRLFSVHMRSHRIVCDVALAITTCWAVASILATSVDCQPLQMLGYKADFCHNLVNRWTAIGTVDCITEIAIVVIAFDGLRPLQMSFSRKMQAFSTFSLRFFIVIFAALHVRSLQQATLAISPGVALTKPTIYLQVELLYALLSAAIPALNRWLRSFDTSVGTVWVQSSSNTRSDGNAIALDSILSTEERNKRLSRVSVMSRTLTKRSSAVMKSGAFVPSGFHGAATEVYAPSHDSEHQERATLETSASTNSDDMIIRKDVQWHVQYERDGSLHRGSK